jgi:autotransporter-associated beta strand protein
MRQLAPAIVGNNASKPTALNPGILDSLRHARLKEPIRFELSGGKFALGQIEYLEHTANEIAYVSGRLTQPESGRFFFQKQTVDGVAGPFVGIVELPKSGLAYRLEPAGPDRHSEWVERSLDQVKCFSIPKVDAGRLPKTEEIPPLDPADFPDVPIPGYQNGVVVLQSLPGAVPVIYLDFQGGYTPTWGGITYQRADFTNAQIRETWQRVAEDFLPFNINVTTDLRVFQDAPAGSRQHVIITPTDEALPNSGGAAEQGSFNWSGDTPCWVFQLGTPKYCAQACSHEAGHTLGLSHEGQELNGQTIDYFDGQGGSTNEVGWAPIMGIGYYDNVTQWSKGEYLNANNQEDQLALIATQNNNVHYRPDDTGDTLATSRYLEIYPDDTASAEGVIETTGDTDAFQFTTAGGSISLQARPVSTGPNLAIQATLYDANDSLLASNNPQTTLAASINTNLPAGTYTFRVTGAGRNDPLTNGFSAYASLGYYSITGTVANARLPDRFVISERSPAGTVVGTIPANNPNHDPLVYTITGGNLGNTFAIDSSGTLSVTNNSLLNYELLAGFLDSQFPVEFQMFADIINPVHPALTETGRRIVVVVTNVFEPPTLTGFTASVSEHSPPGTLVGVVLGNDTDFYSVLTYSIVDGNSNNVFNIDSQTGLITVAGDLSAAVQNVYQLTAVLTDQNQAGVLMATSLVTINVELPYPRGGVAYAVYTNLAGTLISDLTNASSFPHDAAYQKQVALFEGDTNLDGNFGAVLRGYLLPPHTGSYTFWITSDADAELWLSPSTNTSSISKIAYVSGNGSWPAPGEWTRLAGQQSAPITLAAGYAYYIEARQKAGSSINHIAVAWDSAESGISQSVIPGQFLSPYIINYSPHPQGFTNYLHQDAIAGTLIGTVSVNDLNSMDRDSFSLLSGNEAGLFSIDASGRVFLLSDLTSQSLLVTNYVLQVQVIDAGVPPLSGTATVGVLVVPTNAIALTNIQQEIWTNIGDGTAVAFYGTKFPDRPDLLRVLTGFDSGAQSIGTNYGSRIQAFLTPTNTGSYTFFVASSASSQLFLSPTRDPAAEAIIAFVDGETSYREWGRYGSQQSAPVALIAGQQYYLETRHKAAAGNDHVEVAWTGPGLSGTNPISQEILAPVDINAPPDLTQYLNFQHWPLPLQISSTNGTLVTTVTAIDSELDALAYKIVSGNVANTFAMDPTTGRLTVADRTAFATYAVTDFSLVIEVQDSGYAGLFPLKFSQATVNIHIVDDSPSVTWSGGAGNDYWSSVANWMGGFPTNDSRLTFAGIERQTNFNDFLGRAGLIVISNGGFVLTGNHLTLTEGLANTGDNTWNIDSVLAYDQTFTNFSGTLILAAPINNNGYQLSMELYDTLELDAPLFGAGGLTKSGYGNLILNASNSFLGSTFVASGTLTLSNASALASSSDISVIPQSILDVRGVPGGFTVEPGQTFDLEGTVIGPVTIKGGLDTTSDFFAGTFNGNLTLSGTTSIMLGTSIRILGELNCGGDLNVQPFGFGPSGPGEFKLFNASRITGAFRSINLPWPADGLIWETNKLASQGILTLSVIPQQVALMSLTNGTSAIQFQIVQGRTYQLQSATSLQPSSPWTPLTTITGSNTTVAFSTNIFLLTNGIVVTNIWYTDAPSTVVFPLVRTNSEQFFRLRVY